MNKLFRNYLFLLIPLLTMLVVSCKDDEDPIVAPQITSVSPDEGLPGTPVTITGTNLANVTSVTIGGETVTTTNNTATSITATVPTDATPGATQIRVTTAGGTASANFTVLEPDPGVDEATITAVNPTTGGPGTEVTITGTNFTGATAVAVGGTNVEDFDVDEAGENITFTIPEDAAEGEYTGTITVTTPAGAVTSAEDITFTFTPDQTGGQATITGVNPTTVGPGSQVTLTGTNLTGITNLRIGEDTELTEDDFEIDEAGENITFTVPEDATEGYTGGFTVTTAEGEEVAGPEDITITFNMNAPVITAIDPENRTGAVGDVVTITGRNFTDAEVFFVGADGGEVQATLETTSSSDELIFSIPEGAETGPITIRTTVDGEEFEIQTNEFTIGASQQATITGVSEERGIAGYTINLSGENLTGVTGVTVGGQEAEFEEQEDGTLNVTIPEGVEPGEETEIVVTTAAGESEPFTDFAVDDPTNYPTVTAVESDDPEAEEMTGVAGDVLTVTGTNLAAAQVFFGDVEAEVDPTSTPETLIFTIPEGAQTGPIVIRTADGYVYTETFTIGNGGGDGQAINENGSFEDAEVGAITEGSVAGWVFTGNDGELATFEIVDDQDLVQEGDRALAVTIMQVGENPWSIEARQEGLDLEPNTTYSYSIWTMGEEGATANFTVGLPEEGNWAELGRQEVTMTGEWQEVTMEFTTGADDIPVRTPIHFSLEGNAGQTIYIDNLQIMPAQ